MSVHRPRPTNCVLGDATPSNLKSDPHHLSSLLGHALLSRICRPAGVQDAVRAINHRPPFVLHARLPASTAFGQSSGRHKKPPLLRNSMNPLANISVSFSPLQRAPRRNAPKGGCPSPWLSTTAKIQRPGSGRGPARSQHKPQTQPPQSPTPMVLSLLLAGAPAPLSLPPLSAPAGSAPPHQNPSE